MTDRSQPLNPAYIPRQKWRWKLHPRRILHRFYRWYLEKRCGGDHHTGQYGHNGRYIVLMNERQYHRYAAIARQSDPGERFLKIRRDEQSAEDPE